MVCYENLNKLLNASVRRFKDDIDYYGDPITLLFGARVEDLEKGENKLWGNLPKEARVENLELKTDFPAQQKFMEYLEESLYESANIPEGSTKGMKHISNTSGVSLQLQYLPLTELTLRKRITYGVGFKSALMMALELATIVEEKFGLSTGILTAKKKVEKILAESDDPVTKLKPWNFLKVEFQDFMPKDRLIEMQLLKDEMSLGLEDRQGALERLGRDNIEEKLKRIDEEREKMLKDELNSVYGNSLMGNKLTPSGNITQGMRNKVETPAGAAKAEVKE
jgi:hypothetical protein